MLEIALPNTIGFDPARIEQVYDRLALWVHEDKIPGVGIAIGRHGKTLEPRVFGRQRPDMSSPAMPEDAIFLIASITKPLTAMAVMMLVERGELELDNMVVEHIPEFAPNGKDKVRVRHLLTHTSGLPDMPPENERLRAEHQPLEAFVRAICQLKLEFEPGTAVQYQSAGIAMLAEMVRRVSGKPLSIFLRDEVFQPLGLKDTSLGTPEDWWVAGVESSSPQPVADVFSNSAESSKTRPQAPRSTKVERIAHVRVPDAAAKTDWNWNTRYWWSFGAPWGGLLTTPGEFAVICQMFLDTLKGDGPTMRANKGDFGFGQGSPVHAKLSTPLSPAAARAMTLNQLQYMAAVPETDRRTRPWGLGWRLNWPGHSANFGDMLGPRTFGHWGATGTLAWIDPDADAFLVLFTTQPQEPEGRFLARISNMVCAAMI